MPGLTQDEGTEGCSFVGTTLGPYLGMGEKMLRPARNFLMVPLVLNQLCRFSCWVFRKSLLRCFHCWDVNMPRILANRGDSTHGCLVVHGSPSLSFSPHTDGDEPITGLCGG